MFKFGEKVEGHDVFVFNEREVRAAAGIVFLFAYIAFMNAFLLGEMELTKVLVVGFLLDFLLRLFFNPKYAPSMILGRWVVNNQVPEYVGAAQKRWAWGFGFALAVVMFYLVILNDVRGPMLIITCGLCLGLMFFEAVFGICFGCKVYNLFNKESAHLCPGGTCELDRVREDIQKVSPTQLAVLIVFTVIITAGVVFGSSLIKVLGLEDAKRDCAVPEHALEHVEMWKLHNGCLTSQ